MSVKWKKILGKIRLIKSGPFSLASLLFCYLLSFPFPLTRPPCISAPFDIDFTLLSQVNCLSFKLWIFPHFLKLPSPLFGSDSPLTLPSSCMTIEPPAGFCKVHFWRLPPLVAHTSPVHCNNLHSLTTVFYSTWLYLASHMCSVLKHILNHISSFASSSSIYSRRVSGGKGGTSGKAEASSSTLRVFSLFFLTSWKYQENGFKNYAFFPTKKIFLLWKFGHFFNEL